MTNAGTWLAGVCTKVDVGGKIEVHSVPPSIPMYDELM